MFGVHLRFSQTSEKDETCFDIFHSECRQSWSFSSKIIIFTNNIKIGLKVVLKSSHSAININVNYYICEYIITFL